MKYAFTDFVFDSEQLTLYKNKEIVACRYNEAKLLALFLSDPEHIFSKDDILEQVWAGKVVSEQAVFQNISLLRALFGEGAIKTFSKKGYQWQLAVSGCVDEPPIPTSAPSTEVESADVGHAWVIALTILLIVIGSGLAIWRSTSLEAQRIKIAVLPVLTDPNSQDNQTLKTELRDPIWNSLNQTKYFQPVIVSDFTDYSDFYYTPQKYYDQLAKKTGSGIIFLAWIGSGNDNFFIRYVLKSEKGAWAARLQAKTIPLLLEKLNANISLVVQSKILEVSSSDSALVNAKLKVLHEQAADDYVVLSQLADSEIHNGNTNNAILLADTLATKARLESDRVLEAESHVIAANAYVAQSIYEQAEIHLHKAAVLFQREKDYLGLHDVQYAYASLAFAKNDYALLKKSLVSAIEFSQLAKDPLLEVRDNTYLSVMANKFGETNDRQTYLDRAESILDQTHQSTEHYGIIYFYAGMYAETEALAEKNYRKVLSILPASQTWWERERAQAHLADLYIKQARWQEALDLFSGKEVLDASEEFTVSSIYYAQQLWDKSEAHGLNAFKLASLSGQTHLALGAALSLVDIYQRAGTPDKSQAHLQFIHREAKNAQHWIKFNKEKLERLGIEL